VTTRPIVAVVPFGARGSSRRAGAWARQIARRLVDRFGPGSAIELREVFLVAMPQQSSEAGYLVFGSSPDTATAARYATSAGATHALTATYREEGAARAIQVDLVDAATRAATRLDLRIATGGLQRAEGEIAAWLVNMLGVTPAAPVDAPVIANEAAYAALLEGMDEEVDATLLRQSDAQQADRSLQAAIDRYLEATRADPASDLAEERILVLAAESIERADVTRELSALETLITIRPRSWRAHYILGQLRAEARDGNGAIVAMEHAHSLQPLPDADLVRLAELYANAAAPAPALAHLRRIATASPSYGAAQELLAIISFQRGDEATGRAAFARAVATGTTSWELHASLGASMHARGQLDEAIGHYRTAIETGGPSVVRLNLARVLLAKGDREESLRELDAVIAQERTGEVFGHAHRLRFGAAATFGAASATFDRAIAIDPDLWEAHFGRGIVARQRGDAPTAQASFSRVLELQPDQPDALHELGVALLMGNNTKDALAALDHAAALRPDDPAYVADAGFAHLRAGDLASARARLEHATRLDANDPITKSYVGELERVEAAGKRS